MSHACQTSAGEEGADDGSVLLRREGGRREEAWSGAKVPMTLEAMRRLGGGCAWPFQFTAPCGPHASESQAHDIRTWEPSGVDGVHLTSTSGCIKSRQNCGDW